MIIALFVLIFLALGLGYACVNLFAYWKKGQKERNEAQKSQKEWEAFGLATKDENDLLAKYRPIANIDAHIAQIEGEAAAKLASINQELAQKEAVLKEAEERAMAEVRSKTEQAERDSQVRLATINHEFAQKEEMLKEADGKAMAEVKAKTEQAEKDSQARLESIASQLSDKEIRLKETQELLSATKNIVEGYGNEYLVPKEALFDQLAEEYGHEKAGQKLKEARDIVRTMIRKGTASSSRITDKEQNEAAKDFIVDAFNGRIEGILAKAKRLTENYGVLRQQIKDAFSVVNESGRYVGTEITLEFLDARLEELKWGMKVQEIIEEDKEEQRLLKEQLRDEALARKEAEKARKDSERQAEIDQKQKDEAEAEARKRKELEDEIRSRVEATQRELLAKQQAQVSEAEKSKIQLELDELNAKLDTEKRKREEAEGKVGDLEKRMEEAEKKRQTIASNPKGKIYIISNVGSFGEHIFKIGLTRREIEERVKELGDASVPFEFDVHAVIKTNNAPELESKLHQKLSIYRMNKSNWRKEFFKITIEDLKRLIEEEGHETSWTMMAKALQYRETQEIERRIKEDDDFRHQWLSRQAKLDFSVQTHTNGVQDGE